MATPNPKVKLTKRVNYRNREKHAPGWAYPSIHPRVNHPFGGMRGIAVIPGAALPGRRYLSHKSLGSP